MRKFILFALWITGIASATAQTDSENIQLAFSAGSAKELVRYFNKSAEIKINNKGDTYSLVKAEPLLRDFFKLNPPSGFEYIHKGESPQGLKYNIAEYKSGDKTFRIVMLLKKIGDQYLIDTINLNEE